MARRSHARDDRRVVWIGDRGEDALRCPCVAPRLQQRTQLRRRPGIVEVELRAQAVDRDDDDVARAAGPLRVHRAADRAQQGHGGEQAPARHALGAAGHRVPAASFTRATELDVADGSGLA